MSERFGFDFSLIFKTEGAKVGSPSLLKLLQVTSQAKAKNVPAQITEELDNVIGMEECKEQYTEKHCSPESDTLREIRSFTVDTDWGKKREEWKYERKLDMRMMTGKIEGEFLKFLVSMQRANRVLDIGMFTGYSALAMAEAVPSDGVVVTCDVEQHLQDINRKKFDKSPHGAKIDIRIGDAMTTIMRMADEGQRFDFIFIDADKENYRNYYSIIMNKDLLAPHGTIVFDNAFMMGLAYLTDGDPVDLLSRQVEKDPRVRRVLIPIRDGMLMVRRANEVIAEHGQYSPMIPCKAIG